MIIDIRPVDLEPADLGKELIDDYVGSICRKLQMQLNEVQSMKIDGGLYVIAARRKIVVYSIDGQWRTINENPLTFRDQVLVTSFIPGLQLSHPNDSFDIYTVDKMRQRTIETLQVMLQRLNRMSFLVKTTTVY